MSLHKNRSCLLLGTVSRYERCPSRIKWLLEREVTDIGADNGTISYLPLSLAKPPLLAISLEQLTPWRYMARSWWTADCPRYENDSKFVSKNKNILIGLGNLSPYRFKHRYLLINRKDSGIRRRENPLGK